MPNSINLIVLQLTFGGANYPQNMGRNLQTAIYLASALLEWKDWSPLELASLIHNQVPAPQFLNNAVPLVQLLSFAVGFTKNECKVDVYIDNKKTGCVRIGDNTTRSASAVDLAIHILGIPSDITDSIRRNDLVSIRNILEELGLGELKVLLICMLNTRRLLMYFPEEKLIAWYRRIEKC